MYEGITIRGDRREKREGRLSPLFSETNEDAWAQLRHFTANNNAYNDTNGSHATFLREMQQTGRVLAAERYEHLPSRQEYQGHYITFFAGTLLSRQDRASRPFSDLRGTKTNWQEEEA